MSAITAALTDKTPNIDWLAQTSGNPDFSKTAPSPMIPVYAPDGTLGEVPYDRVHDALKAGGKIGVHMRAPDGTEGTIPAEQTQAAFKAGGKVIPWDFSKADFSHAEKPKGVWNTFVDDVKSAFTHIPLMVEPLPGETQEQADTRRKQEVEQGNVARKEAGYSKTYQAVAPYFGSEGMEQGAAEANSDAVLGHMLSNQALTAAPLAAEELFRVSPKVLKATKNAVQSAREAGTEAFRTEGGTGPLKPTIKATAQIGSGLAGAAPGIAHGNLPAALAGGAAGYKLGPSMAESLFPAKAGTLREMGAPFPSADEFYANRGAELNAIRRQTITMENAAARAKAAAARVQAKEGAAVPITQSPNYDPGAYKAGVAQRTTPAPTQPRIVSPEAGAPKVAISEGRPATWTNERVIQLASQGNRDGIAQAVRRGLMLPENARYVMGDADFAAGTSNPRSVTKFSPTGEPITQGESSIAYRSRDVGEKGIPANSSHAHAGTSQSEIESYMPGRESVNGKPQELVKVDLTKLQEGKDFVRIPRPGQSDWIRFLHPLDEAGVEKLPQTNPKPHRFSNSSKARQEILDRANKPLSEQE